MIGDFSTAPAVEARKFCNRLARQGLTGLVFVALAISAAAQLPSLTKTSAPPTAPSPEQVSDPLGRSTPRGTILGFIKAANRDDFVTAARYLQITSRQKVPTETLVSDLKELMNRYFSEPLAMISDTPEGAMDDGLTLDRERAGSLKISDNNKVDLLLVRIVDPQAGRIWVISSETLASVPRLFDVIQGTWIERVMPEPLLNHKLFSISLAKWIVWVASIALPLLFLGFVFHLAVRILTRKVENAARRAFLLSWYNAVRSPVVFILTVTVNLLVVYSLRISLSSRMIYGRFGLVLLVIGLAWLLQRTLTLSFQRARSAMQNRGDTGTQSLMLLVDRLLRVAITLGAIFSILTIIGVDTKTALAGVGIGGVAIAFGAQKTVENLLGGIFLLTDKALAMGDTCRIGDRVGTVEDITLRSIRLRTLEQTLLSIPAGALSQSNIENFATRSKIPVQTTLELRYGTTTEQLKSVLDGIRRLLAENPRLETDTSSVRLTRYGAQSIQLELFAYVRTRNDREFQGVREDLLLHIAEVIEASGSGFAIPAQPAYIPRTGETGVERRSEPEFQARDWHGHEESRASCRTADPVSRVQSPSPETKTIPKRAS